HGGGRRAAGEAREDEVRVAAARVDRSDEGRTEAHAGDSLELAAGVVHALERKPSRREETLGGRRTIVARPVVVGAREGGGAVDHHGAPVEDRLVRVLPVGPAHDVAVLRLDVLAPDLVGVVDVRVAVEDRKTLLDTAVSGHRSPRPSGGCGRRPAPSAARAARVAASAARARARRTAPAPPPSAAGGPRAAPGTR